jgi:chromosome segregation ATPase
LLFSFIATINTEIDPFNIKLDNRKETIEGLENEFWQIQRKKYDQTISNYIATEENLRAEQEQIQGQIDAIDEEIKKQKKIISTNQSKVSKLNVLKIFFESLPLCNLYVFSSLLCKTILKSEMIK